MRKIQKYRCQHCRHIFYQTSGLTRYRFSTSFIHEAVKRLVASRNSLDIASHDLKVSRPTLISWLRRFTSNTKTPLQADRELKPQYGGTVGIDGDWIKVAGENRCILVGIDKKTSVIANFEYAGSEYSLDYKILFLTLIKMNYPFRGIVSDRNGNIRRWAQRLLPKVPHQFCCAHFMREVDSKIKYGYILRRIRGSQTKESSQYFKTFYKPETDFRKKIYNILYAKTEKMARKRLAILVRQRAKFPDKYHSFIVSLVRDADYFFRHYKVRGLPRSNNFTELVINQIENRNKLIEGFQSDETAENFVRLFIHYLNQKKFTFAKKKYNYKNGKSPLQLAKCNLKTTDWLKFSQK